MGQLLEILQHLLEFTHRPLEVRESVVLPENEPERLNQQTVFRGVTEVLRTRPSTS